jgi:hypothetical protein
VLTLLTKTDSDSSLGMLEKAGNRLENFFLTPLKTPWESDSQVDVTSCMASGARADDFWVALQSEFRANRFQSRKTVTLSKHYATSANTRN